MHIREYGKMFIFLILILISNYKTIFLLKKKVGEEYKPDDIQTYL